MQSTAPHQGLPKAGQAVLPAQRSPGVTPDLRGIVLRSQTRVWDHRRMSEAEKLDEPDHWKDPAFRAAVEEALEDVREGRTIPIEEVRRWVESWGTDHELPRPECK